MFHILVERVNMAVNAVIAAEAAAARQMMAAQALADCREQNNPYLPGNAGILGPTRSQMWGPDPCLTQEKELAAATIANQAAQAAAQITGAPTAQALQAAVAPQLSETETLDDLLNPAIPETEFVTPDSSLENMWSPGSIEETMIKIAEELEKSGEMGPEEEKEMEVIYENATILLNYWCWNPPAKKRKRYKFLPNNQNWIGKWTP